MSFPAPPPVCACPYVRSEIGVRSDLYVGIEKWQGLRTWLYIYMYMAVFLLENDLENTVHVFASLFANVTTNREGRACATLHMLLGGVASLIVMGGGSKTLARRGNTLNPEMCSLLFLCM